MPGRFHGDETYSHTLEAHIGRILVRRSSWEEVPWKVAPYSTRGCPWPNAPSSGGCIIGWMPLSPWDGVSLAVWPFLHGRCILGRVLLRSLEMYPLPDAPSSGRGSILCRMLMWRFRSPNPRDCPLSQL